MNAPLYSLVLPLPPSINHYYEHVSRKITRGEKAGKIFTSRKISAEGMVFRSEVAAAVRRGHRTPPRLTGRLSLRAIVFPADARRHDLDNRLKAAQDALVAAGVLLDDAQFDEVLVVRGPITPPRGAFRLGIWRLDPEEGAKLAAALGVTIVDLLSRL